MHREPRGNQNSQVFQVARTWRAQRQIPTSGKHRRSSQLPYCHISIFILGFLVVSDEMIRHVFYLYSYLYLILCIKHDDRLCQTASRSWSPNTDSSVNARLPLPPESVLVSLFSES
jgi:hypothetical protein